MASMLEMCKSPMRDCILAHDMGLGKPVQALGPVQAVGLAGGMMCEGNG